ncbi:hypothetical protein R6Q59_013457 [Mikania micrantha]|uniref:Uncharacterized protein n=1 Tax=Mikania micrantha TaxID=192012 RepID=A0A5N6P6C4_9ASTR|nr:hypothetical protein E3N88_11795 [Mikania micrantha]
MGTLSHETRMLKLVRAGGLVELYKHPIIAAQVMERYPRHCVTRPDFFRNPYIVVKPESVLRPGQVFFIVPNHTVYCLFKSKGYYCNRHYTQTFDQMDTSLLRKIVPFKDIRNKKESDRRVDELDVELKRDNLVLKDGDYDSGDGGRSSCLKPCLKKNRPDKAQVQQRPRVRFRLPDDDDEDGDDDDEKWEAEFSYF